MGNFRKKDSYQRRHIGIKRCRCGVQGLKRLNWDSWSPAIRYGMIRVRCEFALGISSGEPGGFARIKRCLAEEEMMK